MPSASLARRGPSGDNGRPRELGLGLGRACTAPRRVAPRPPHRLRSVQRSALRARETRCSRMRPRVVTCCRSRRARTVHVDAWGHRLQVAGIGRWGRASRRERRVTRAAASCGTGDGPPGSPIEGSRSGVRSAGALHGDRGEHPRSKAVASPGRVRHRPRRRNVRGPVVGARVGKTTSRPREPFTGRSGAPGVNRGLHQPGERCPRPVAARDAGTLFDNRTVGCRGRSDVPLLGAPHLPREEAESS